MMANQRYYEICKYVVGINAIVNYHQIVVNDEWYQSLPDDLKKVFDESLEELFKHMGETVSSGEDAMYKICEDNGMTVTRLTEEQVKVWADACKGTYNKMKADVGDETVRQIEDLLKG